MKLIRFTFILLLSITAGIVKAQFQQGFEPVTGNNTPIIGLLRDQCWNIDGLSINAGAVAPISGSQTFVTGTAATQANRGFITPYMLFTGNDSVAFSYKYYGAPGNFQRWFLLKVITDLGQVTTLDSVFINTSNNAVINFNKKIIGFSGRVKVFVNYRGANSGINGSRTGFDDFFFSSGYFYATGCVDTDLDGVSDIKDADDDNDGIPDVVEVCGLGATSFACLGSTPISSNPARDLDGDGIDNYLDANFCALNSNGVCSALDFDGDGIPNHLDLDSDNDGIPDAIEANGGMASLNYLNGVINSPVGPNGMPNSAETGINTGLTNFPMTNTSGIGNPDYLNSDSDNDGIVDNIEAQATFAFIAASGIDTDRDGVDDAYDNISGMFMQGLVIVNTDGLDLPDYLDTDSDNDGRLDIVEAHDANGNNIQDGAEMPFTASGIDSDNDGLDDSFDVVIGFSVNNGGQTPLSFPDAQFGTTERDWRESPFGPEICNNGVDDDGDGFVDCADGDCGTPVITLVQTVNSNPCSNSNNGTITVSAINAIGYSIDNGLIYSSDSSFTNLQAGQYNVVVKNANGCETAYANNPLEILASNCAPIAIDDAFTVDQNTVLIGTSLIANDDSTDGPNFTINQIPVTAPTSGTLVINADGTFTYTPNNGFTGIDQFQYQVCDGASPELCDTALVVISVIQNNQNPIVQNESVSVDEDNVLIGNVLTNDVDNDGTLSVNSTLLQASSNGSFVILANGDYTYTPNLNYNGLDTAIVAVCDNLGACVNDTIFITVNPINDLPIIVSEHLTVLTNTVLTDTILSNDFDVEGPLTVTTTQLFGPLNGTIVMANNGGFSYTPNTNFVGIDLVWFQVCDTDGACANDTIFITVVAALNIPPVVANDYYNVQENASVSDNFLLNDNDPDGTLIVGLPPLQGPSNGVFIANALGIFTYTPNIGFVGLDTVIINVCDNSNACAFDTLFFNVTPLSTLPIVNNDFLIVNEDASANGNILFNDFSSVGNLTSTIIITAAHGTFTLSIDGFYTYTPIANYNGLDTVITSVCDVNSVCINDTLFITVLPIVDPIVINNEQFTTSINQAISDNILINDSDVDGILSVIVPQISGPLNGAIILSSNGNFTYIPNNGFFGFDTIYVQVCSTSGPCGIDTLVIQVLNANTPPNVQSESFTTLEDNALSGNILANDSDLEGPVSYNGPGSVIISTGTLTISPNGNFFYMPNQNYFGSFFVVLSVCDTDGLCANDTLFITVTPVNDLPIVLNESFTTGINILVSNNLLANDSDVEGPLTANTTPVAGPFHGTIAIAPNGNFVYTPSYNYSGNDTIVVIVCDTDSFCVNDTIFITVTPGNNWPVVLNETFIVFQDLNFNGNIILNDFDLETGVTVTLPALVDAQNGTLAMFTNGAFFYAPNTGFLGNDFAVYNVCDFNGACAIDTVFFIVIPAPNLIPIVSNDFYTLNENTSISDNFMITDYDNDGTISASIPAIVDVANGVLIYALDGTFTYTPNANFVGNDFAIIQVCDNDLACINDTLFFTVLPANTPPIINNEHIIIDEDTPAIGNILLNDSDAQGPVIASLIIVQNPANGIASILANGDFIYTPNLNFNGNDTIIFSVCDTSNNCINDTVFIQVNPINDALVIVNDSFTTDENTPLSGSITTNDNDPDGTILVVNTTPLVLPANGIILIQPNGNFDYVPNNGFSGIDTVVVEICDIGFPLPATCGNDTLFITVIDVNLPPVLFNDNVSTNEDVVINGTFLTTDFDPEGTALNATTIPVFGPTNGTIVIDTNGNFTYTPNLNYYGVDTVVVQICDNGLPLPAACSFDTLIITINPINDAPTIVNDTISTLQDQVVTGNILLNDSDIENTALHTDSIALIGPFNGTIIINTNGDYTYTPNAGYYGQDTVIVTVCDSGFPLPALCVSDTLIITINPVAAIANAGIDQTICSTSTTLSGNATPVGSGLWTIASGTATFADSSLFNTTVSDLTIGQNVLVWSITSNTGSTSDTLIVNVVSALAQPNAGTDKTICAFSDTLNADVPLVGTGVWTNIAGAGIISNPIAAATLVSSLGVGSNVFVWTVSNLICPSLSDTITVTVTQNSSAPIAGIDLQICGTSITLNATLPALGTGYWTSANTAVAFTDSLSTTSQVFNLQSGNNELIWNTQNGVCPVRQDTVSVFTFQNASAPFAGNDTTICSNQIQLNANEITIGMGQWEITNSNGTIDDVYNRTALFSGLSDGENSIVWTTANGVCPLQTDTLIITVQACPDTAVFVPEGFSPNGDGVNDVFVVNSNGKTVSVQFFNRWGSKVYENNNYQNDWGGNNSDSKELLDATYYYIIKVEGEAKARTGYITLWR